MRLRLLIRIAVIVSIVLLCTGLGIYSFLQLDAVNRQKDFNLYAVVPQDALAVLETDRLAELMDDIGRMECSKDGHFLYFSELFVCLKQYFYTLMDDTPHGLSRQMNKVLISFHEPDTPMNQVMYCTLGAGDAELVETFIRKYSSSSYPSKRIDYKGEEIRIYPMSDGRFLAVYLTPDFLAFSFQKRLIEQVIDAARSKRSLMELPSFKRMYTGKHANVSATIYLRMKSVDMGKRTDGLHVQTRLGNWAEFDLKLDEEAIYCSGVSQHADSAANFINVLRKLRPIEGFCGEQLPASTFFYTCCSLSDVKAMLDFAASQEYAKADYPEVVKKRDGEWFAYLSEFAGDRMLFCLFQSKDTADNKPCAVVAIPLKDVRKAEGALQDLIYSVPREGGEPMPPKFVPDYARYPRARWNRKYLLPRSTLLPQLTGITESSLYAYASLYKDTLLLAPDGRSLSAYVDALEEGSVLPPASIYGEGMRNLSQAYNLVMMVDMEEMLEQPEAYVRLVPNFFFRQHEFFRHFMLAIQFTCVEGVIYPNIVLLYNRKPTDEPME